jgi:hypothetical protein
MWPFTLDQPRMATPDPGRFDLEHRDLVGTARVTASATDQAVGVAGLQLRDSTAHLLVQSLEDSQ